MAFYKYLGYAGGMAGLQACTLAFLSGMAGGLIDLISCCFNPEKKKNI